MNNNKKTIILLAVFIVLLAAAVILYNILIKSNSAPNQTDNTSLSASAQNNLSIGSSEEDYLPSAIDFNLLDNSESEVSLSSYYGKPIVLNFWASWCPPCKAELPDFNDAYNTYKDDVTFIMANLTDGNRETISSAKSYIENNSYDFPVYFDKYYEGSDAYAITSIPTTYIINSDGKIVYKKLGIISKNELTKQIEKVLN